MTCLTRTLSKMWSILCQLQKLWNFSIEIWVNVKLTFGELWVKIGSIQSKSVTEILSSFVFTTTIFLTNSVRSESVLSPYKPHFFDGFNPGPISFTFQEDPPPKYTPTAEVVSRRQSSSDYPPLTSSEKTVSRQQSMQLPPNEIVTSNNQQSSKYSSADNNYNETFDRNGVDR